MSSAPQGFINYANIPPEAVVSGNMTSAHGITPAVCTLVVAPTPQIPSWTGEIRLTYDTVQLTFPDCRMMNISQRIDGRTIRWVLHIQDRRWRWKFGRVRGRFNFREPPRNRVMPVLEKKPTEMLEILLASLGESNWQFIDVPNDVRPFVEWDEQPAGALQRLVDSLGCRLWINPVTNLVTVSKVGIGQPLPFNPLITEDTLTCDPPVPPDNLMFIGGPDIYQDDFPLEAVALESTAETVQTVAGPLEILPGFVRPIDEVTWAKNSYQDTDPWQMSYVDLASRNAARESLWKWYRIKMPCEPDPGWTGEGNHWDLQIDDLARIRPLQATQLEWHLVGGERVPMPPFVYGNWDNGHYMFALDRPDTSVHVPWGDFPRVESGFSLDTNRGIVKFSEEMYRTMNRDANPPFEVRNPHQMRLAPAKLWLRIAFSLRDETDYSWNRFLWPYPGQQPVPGGTEHWVAREDEFRARYWTYGAGVAGMGGFFAQGQPGVPQDNIGEVAAAAEYYMEQEMRKFVLQFPGSRTYAGLLPIELDGAIQSVTWNVGEDGRATTTAHRNREDFFRQVPYAERQQMVLMDQMRRHAVEADTNVLDKVTGTRRFGMSDIVFIR